MSKAPSRQSHSCGVCGKVYSRSEYVRRHYLAKHAPKLDCPESGCGQSFARQDLLIRHLRVYHPGRETPSPAELAEQLDLPPPMPVHQDSMDSTSSWNSGASTSNLSLLGGPVTNSPELMARAFELPTPPVASSSTAGTNSTARRTATYPLPLNSSLPPVPLPYVPYHLPAFTSLPPSSYQSPTVSPATSHFLPYPIPQHHGSSGSTVRGRSQTMPAPLPDFSGSSMSPYPDNPPFTPTQHRPALVDASVQTDLLASHIPLDLFPSPIPHSAAHSIPHPQYQHHLSHCPHPLSQNHHPDRMSVDPSSSNMPLPLVPQNHLSPAPLQPHQHSAQQSDAAALAAFLTNLQHPQPHAPEPSPFRLDDYNPFQQFGSPTAGQAGGSGLGGAASPQSGLQ